MTTLPLRCAICAGLASDVPCEDPCPPFPTKDVAAREVVRQVRGYLAMFNGTPELRWAVAVYDEAN